jgi:hypothetical protein
MSTGLRIAVGSTLGYLLSIALDLQGSTWVVITVVMVLCTESRTGGIVRKSLQRFSGTVLGAAVAMALLALFPQQREWGLLCSLPALLAFGALSARPDQSYVGVMAAVTLVMVLLEPTSDLFFALKRVLQIVLGLGVVLIVSQLVLPDHARTRLRRSLAAVLEDLSEMARESGPSEALEARIVSSLSEQRKLAPEARMEGELLGPEEFERFMIAERRAFRYLYILSQAPDPTGFLPQVAQGLKTLAGRMHGVDAPPEWPTGEYSDDPVHRVCAQRLLEACRALEGCLEAR